MVAQVAADVPPTGPLEGRWGGDRLQLVVSAGSSKLEMDCASGSFAVPLRLNAAGQFAVQGQFERRGGGPQRADETPAAAPARYTGELHGDVLTLRVWLPEAQAPMVFTLRKGVSVKLVRCL